MAIHNGIFSPQWIITTATVYIKKTREEKVIDAVGFSPNFAMSYMPLGYAKICAAHYFAQLLPP